MENLLPHPKTSGSKKKKSFSKPDPDAQNALDQTLATIRLGEFVNKPAGLLSHEGKTMAGDWDATDAAPQADFAR